jgi:predicted glycosyltransferase
MIRALEARGDEVLVTARVKYVALDMLRAYDIA